MDTQKDTKHVTELSLPSKPARPEFGDVLYGQKWISSWPTRSDLNGRRYVSLVWGNSYRWVALNNLIGAEKLLEEVTYECPFIKGNRYFWMAPLGILINNSERTYPFSIANLPDSEIIQTIDDEETGIEYISYDELIPDLTRSIIGHGYTHGTLPCDGSGEPALATIPLANGDEILMLCWQWFNK